MTIRQDACEVPARPLRIVAIVPVHDGGDDIAACLDGLLAAGQPLGDILVVDDASTDDAARVACGERGVACERLVGDLPGPGGPARARNAGARVAGDADAFLFVDADVIVHEDVPERFRTLLATHREVAAAFGSYDARPPAAGWISQYKNLLHHRMHQLGSREACTFWSGLGIVRRDAFVDIGGFHEGFGNASIEDVDLGLRLTDAGYRIRLSPDIQCTHLKRWTLMSWLRTDIVHRAIPWSRLLIERRQGIPDSLNLGYRERVSAVLALVIVLSLAILPFAPVPVGAVMTAVLIAFVFVQRGLLGFLARHRGIGFAAVATLLHVCYYVYSSAVFASVRVVSLASMRARPRCP